MVWKTNFDRHLEGYTLATVVKQGTAATAAAAAVAPANSCSDSNCIIGDASAVAKGSCVSSHARQPSVVAGQHGPVKHAPVVESPAVVMGNMQALSASQHGHAIACQQAGQFVALDDVPIAITAADASDFDGSAGNIQQTSQVQHMGQPHTDGWSGSSRDMLQVPATMNLEGVPGCVAATLQHLVAQMDALVAVVRAMEVRVRQTEEQLAQLEQR
eukprot:GHRR01030495.1.p1 GENE.GHRR01030495.1~~GHRR01030495.1.p1  ORF type:complete len:215 (+),score=92.41 GHRR01030495.1:745-1389(+)